MSKNYQKYLITDKKHKNNLKTAKKVKKPLKYRQNYLKTMKNVEKQGKNHQK